MIFFSQTAAENGPFFRGYKKNNLIVLEKIDEEMLVEPIPRYTNLEYAHLEKILPRPSQAIASTTLEHLLNEISHVRTQCRLGQISYILSFDTFETLLGSLELLQRIVITLKANEQLIVKFPLRYSFLTRILALFSLLKRLFTTSLKLLFGSLILAAEVACIEVTGGKTIALSYDDIEKLLFHFELLNQRGGVQGALWFSSLLDQESEALLKYAQRQPLSEHSMDHEMAAHEQRVRDRALLASLLSDFLDRDIPTESERFQLALLLLKRSKGPAMEEPIISDLRVRLIFEIERQLKKRNEKIPVL